MEETIPIKYFLMVLGGAWAFLSIWLWKLHDSHQTLRQTHHELATKVAEKYVPRDDMQALTTDIKVDIRMVLNEIKAEMRSDRAEIMAAIATKQDKL